MSSVAATVILLVLNLLFVVLPVPRTAFFGRWINVVAVVSLSISLIAQLSISG